MKIELRSSEFLKFVRRKIKKKFPNLQVASIYESIARYLGFRDYHHLQNLLKTAKYETFPRITHNEEACIAYLKDQNFAQVEEYIGFIEEELFEDSFESYNIIESLLFHYTISLHNVINYHECTAVFPGMESIKFRKKSSGVRVMDWWHYSNPDYTDEAKKIMIFDYMLNYLEMIPDIPLITIPHYQPDPFEMNHLQTRPGYTTIFHNELYIVSDAKQYVNLARNSPYKIHFAKFENNLIAEGERHERMNSYTWERQLRKLKLRL